jgi:hypothetical protein
MHFSPNKYPYTAFERRKKTISVLSYFSTYTIKFIFEIFTLKYNSMPKTKQTNKVYIYIFIRALLEWWTFFWFRWHTNEYYQMKVNSLSFYLISIYSKIVQNLPTNTNKKNKWMLSSKKQKYSANWYSSKSFQISSFIRAFLLFFYFFIIMPGQG